MPVAHTYNLPTQKAEIRRILVQSHPGQIVPQDSFLEKNFHKKGLVEAKPLVPSY
jgi:hypothetical protein